MFGAGLLDQPKRVCVCVGGCFYGHSSISAFVRPQRVAAAAVFQAGIEDFAGSPSPASPPPPAPHLCSGHGELAVVRGRTRSPRAPDRPSGTCHRRWAPRARHLCTRVMPRFFPSPSASYPFALFTPASVSEVSLSVILDSSTAPGDKRTRRLFPDGAVDLGNSERPPRRRRERSTLSNRGPRLFLFLHSVGLWFPQCVPD